MDIQNTRGHSEKNSYNLPPYTNDQLRLMLSLIDKKKIDTYQLNNIEDLRNAIDNNTVDLNYIFNTREQFDSLIKIFHLRSQDKLPYFLKDLKLKGGKRRSKKRRGNRRKSTRRRSRR
jgi:hypothetical protein